MKSVIFSIFCFFLFKLAVVLANKNMCNTCDGVNSDTCKDVEEECPEGSDCMTISEEFVCLDKIFRSVSKRCTLNLHCNTSFLANAGLDIYVRTSQQCCTGNRCNSGYFQLPNLDTHAKGILCPFCYAFNTTEGCNATSWTTCLGKNDQCISFRGTMKLPDGCEADFSAQGCSSKMACDYGYSQLIGLQITRKLESKCYVPTSSPSLPGTYPKN